MKYAVLIVFLFAADQMSAQHVGYRIINLTDSSRRYAPNAHPGDPLYYRPVDIDIWYPAGPTASKPLPFGWFLQLFQERANALQQDTVYRTVAAETAQFLCAGLGIKDTASLTNAPTQTHLNATPIQKKFPLIIYLCSYNGMCFENIRLFEALAKQGYIVASITSIGRYPGNMSMDPADLQEQATDAQTAIKTLQKTRTIDTTAGLGLIGYSWGGPAAFLLQNTSGVKALLSLDGSELHYYGHSREDDSNFNLLRPALLAAAKTSAAYAYLESDGKQSDHPADSIFNLLPALQSPKKYHLFPGATHEDFSCLPLLAATIHKKAQPALPDYTAFALRWFDNYLKHKNNPPALSLRPRYMPIP